MGSQGAPKTVEIGFRIWALGLFFNTLNSSIWMLRDGDIRVCFLGVPKLRIMVFLGGYSGFPYFGNYHMDLGRNGYIGRWLWLQKDYLVAEFHKPKCLHSCHLMIGL